jgi:tetratricopeptide (TPR) repeat protein
LLFLFYVLATPVVVFFMSWSAFEDTWIAAGLTLLVVVLPISVYLSRPEVRDGFALLYTLWQGNRAAARGEFTRSEDLARRAVAIADASRGERDLPLAMALVQLGDVYRVQGRLAEAEPVFRQALQHYSEANPYIPVRRGTTLLSLSAVLIGQGRFVEAEPICREALTILVNAGHDERITAMLNLGQAFSGQGKYADAERETRRAVDLLTPRIERGELLGCIALSNLADISRRQARLDEAEPLARRSVTLIEKSPLGPDHPHVARLLNVLAETLRQQEKLDEAESLCLRSQALTEKSFGPDHVSLDRCLSTLARMRTAQGRFAEAEALYRRCLTILEQAMPDHRERALRMEEYASLLRQLGRAREAAEWDNRVNSLTASTASRNE